MYHALKPHGACWRIIVWTLVFTMSFAMAAPAVAFALESAEEAPAPQSIVDETVRPYSWSASNVRIAGADRLATSVAVSQQGWDSSEYVVIATSQMYADALVGGPLAYLYDAPILPTEPDSLPQNVADEIARLGATNAIILGGTQAVSRAVEADLLDAGITDVERIGGIDRYDTAGLIAQRFADENGGAEGVILATGEGFADALAVSGFAGFFGTPILLTARDQVPAGTLSALGSIDPNATLIIGGTAAVSGEVEGSVPNPVRIGGDNRYDTARLIAEFAFANGFTYESVFTATGLDFPDALAVGPLAAKMGAPLVLTDPFELPQATSEFFNNHCSSIETVFILGGLGAVSQAVAVEIEAATETQVNEQLEVVTGAMETAVTTITAEGTIVLPEGTPGLESIEESSVLVAGPSPSAPYGYLVRVTTMTVGPSATGNEVSIETTMASLGDAILKGSIDITGSPDPNFGAPDEPTFAVESAEAIDDSSVQLAVAPKGDELAQPALDIGGQYNMPFSLSVNTPDKGGVSGSAGVAGNVFASGSFVFNISYGTVGYYWAEEWYFNWGWKTRWVQKPIYGVQNFETKVYFGLGLELNFEGANVEYEFDVVEYMQEHYAKKTRVTLTEQWIWVGWVPIHMGLHAQPIITLGASFGGELDTGFKLSCGATVGVAYDYRYGWRNLSGVSPYAQWNPWNPTATASLGFAIGVEFDVKFYGLIGPTIGAQAAMELSATSHPEAGDRWWTADLTVQGVAGGEFEIFDKKWSIGASFDLFSWDLAAAPPGPFGTPGVEWFPSAVPDTGTNPNCLPVFWDVSPAGSNSLAADSVVVPTAEPPLVLDATTVGADDFQIAGVDILSATVLPSGTDILLETSPLTGGEAYVVSSPSGQFFDMTNKPNMLAASSFTGYYEPELVDASSDSSTTVTLFFDNGFGSLDPGTVEPADFTLPGLTVTGAEVGFGGSTVDLTTTPQTAGTAYDVSIAGGEISSAEGFPSTASSAGFAGYWPVTCEYAYDVDATTVEVVFDSMDQLAAGSIDPGDFMVTERITETPLAVTAAALQPDGRTVQLTTDPSVPGLSYEVAVAADSISDGTFGSLDSATTYTGSSSSYAVGPGNIPASQSLIAMGSTEPGIAYATGMSGLTYRTMDGGVSWVQVATAQPGAVGNSYDIGFPIPGDSSTLVTQGFAGSISRSTDFANSWTRYYDAAVTTNHNGGLAFAGSTGRGYITHGGGGTIETTDGGVTWHRHPTQDTEILGASLRFGDDFHGVLGAPAGLAWYTSDSGATWTSVPTGLSGTLNRVMPSPEDPMTFIVVSSLGEIARTEDGGQTWTPVASGTALPLYEVEFADGNVVFAGGEQGIVLMSRDAGRTWSTIRAAVGANPSVGAMWVRDPNYIVIGGLNGYNLIINGS